MDTFPYNHMNYISPLTGFELIVEKNSYKYSIPNGINR